jgi:hypothetical protein
MKSKGCDCLIQPLDTWTMINLLLVAECGRWSQASGTCVHAPRQSKIRQRKHAMHMRLWVWVWACDNRQNNHYFSTRSQRSRTPSKIIQGPDTKVEKYQTHPKTLLKSWRKFCILSSPHSKVKMMRFHIDFTYGLLASQYIGLTVAGEHK